MPELPEVDAITGIVARHSIGQVIEEALIAREPANSKYFGGKPPIGRIIQRVYRRGKHVLFELSGGLWIDCHNAMTGYWDYEDEPWAFDYVEAERSTWSHTRMRMRLSNGKVLRFNDARLFGRLRIVDSDGLPRLGPELMTTPHGPAGVPVISLAQFAAWILSEHRPVKDALMDQGRLAGIGNIYSNEGCHLAGIDPHISGKDIRPVQIPLLLEALRCVVSHSIPKIQYQWRKVYRRDLCGSCGSSVFRTEIAKRATFMCNNCQGEPKWEKR